MRHAMLTMGIAAAAVWSAPATAQEDGGARPSIMLERIATYDPTAWSQEATECDRLAAHPDDPDIVAPGVPQPQMDVEAAIAACRASLDADPGHPRLNYQLARATAYAGRHAESAPHQIAAAEAGYPQALFVLGFIRLNGWDGAPPEPCVAGELIRRSAAAGRFAGQVGFPHYALSGRFEGCADLSIDPETMLADLEAAESGASDFYRAMLVAELKARVAEMAR